MAIETISGNDDDHQSIHTATLVAASSPDPRYASSRKLHQFPKHATVKLSEHNFLLWKQQILLILEGYGLHKFVLGTVQVPPQSVLDRNGTLVPNPDFVFHKQQDKLLASWLLSTISDGILVYLISACSSFDVWSIVVRRFATKSSLTVSTMRHSLYFQEKGQLTFQEYLSKIKSLCDTLLAAGNVISSATSSAPMLNDDSPENQGVTALWECQSCTLLNPPLAPICKLCCTERPRDIGTKYKFWSCKFCTLKNSVKLDKCSACDQWRYAHGAPISTPAPNVGT